MRGWRRIPAAAVALIVVVAWACGGGGSDEEEAGTESAVDSVAMAESSFSLAAFDTIEWDSAGAALERGGVVWSYSCAKCHGESGAGDGGFVSEGDTLRPPSLAADDWRLAGDPDGIRRQIYTGTTEGMPHWGLVGLTHRDVDAVAMYIRRGIRGESE